MCAACLHLHHPLRLLCIALHPPPQQENVSLADILSLRDSCLTEEEVWAMSGECVLALRSIQPTQLFHSLCITPDTLAFNAHGNVCFMEQLSGEARARSLSLSLSLSLSPPLSLACSCSLSIALSLSLSL